MTVILGILFIALGLAAAFVAGYDLGQGKGYRTGYKLGHRHGWEDRRAATWAVLDATRKNLGGIRLKVWNLFGAMMDALEEKP